MSMGAGRQLNAFWRATALSLTATGIVAIVYYIFNFHFFGTMLNIAIRFLAIAIFLPLCFILMPWKRGATEHLLLGGIPIYDTLCALASLAIPFYFFTNAYDIAVEGWRNPPNTGIFILGLVLCLLVLEAGRRGAGNAYFLICLILGLYPLICDKLPGVLYGRSYSFTELIGSTVFGPEIGLIGLPTQVKVDILAGFLVFAAVLLGTGAGKFFIDLAFGLVGRYRGGPAKVSVLGSMLFGTMSGSAIANVVGVGSITIPAMKSIGFEPKTAAGVEACASCGGILMPPVMGSVAFLMATFLDVSYASICVAAAIPAILYYYILIIQVDSYSAKMGLKGLPKESLPPILKTLKHGWHYAFAIAFLVWGLMYMRWEAMTPYYTSVVLIALSMVRKDTRVGWVKLKMILREAGRVMSLTMGVLLPIVFVIGGLTNTGVVAAVTNGFIRAGGGNPYVILFMGGLISFLLGTVGVGGYIFLAISLAPALISMGIDPYGVHLFIIYYSMLGVITPPIATAAFVAAAIAGSPPIATAVRATRFGIGLLFIPFFFCFQPALLFRGGSILDTIFFLSLCLIGIFFLASGLEGYLVFIGKLTMWSRILLVTGGAFIAFPETMTSIIGGVLTIATLATLVMLKRMKGPRPAPVSTT